MKAVEANLLKFLRKSPQFIIPIYQRTYSWKEEECRQLWDDIIRTGGDDKVKVHFIGSIVYIEEGLSQVTLQSPVLVIDGQQRLTTVSLLLAALANAIPPDTEAIDGFSPRKLRNYYLLNPDETGERHFKLILSQTDRESLKAIVGGNPQPLNSSIRVTKNYEMFQSLIASSKDLTAICHGLAKLVVVDIALTRGEDNPQLIFESMNSTGKELSQADLIRNYVLMSLEPNLQTHLYEHYWRTMEQDFGQEAYGTHFDSFMRHYLTRQTGDIPNVSAVYDAFKNYALTKDLKNGGLEALVKDIRNLARYYCNMALGKEPDAELKVAFDDLRELRVDVAYPLLLELYDDYSKGVLPKPEFLQAVRMIETYVFRRAICAIPTNSMNKTFAHFSRSLKKDSYLESIKVHFLTLKSHRRFPTNEEFKRDIQVRDLYNNSRKSYWMRRLENYKRRELVLISDYTIEHIMPQSLDSDWKRDLGTEADRIHQTYLHTLGNLTLTAYNAQYSNHRFALKRDMDGGFKTSPLFLNAHLGQVDAWDESSINARALRLANQALEVWPIPVVADPTLLQPQPKKKNKYTVDDYPHLQTSLLRNLFEKLSQEIVAFDPRVKERYFKWLISYETTKCFAYVTPQASRLRVIIDLPIDSVPTMGIPIKSITNKKRWDFGFVKVFLSAADQLPDVVLLCRQAFERQVQTTP